MSLQPGQSFGGYTIVAKLGEGGMGEVYRATDSRLGRDVAIKILPASVSSDPDRRARFEREAKALAALNHFNIAQVYGFEDTAIVMELLEGQTLRDRVNDGSLPIRKALDFGAQIARGLAAAHERGIIHRDLKPENVFVVNDGQIKILDFGLARQAASGAPGATETREGTAPGVVMGTAGYMSPEQVRGVVVDPRSDVFALGVILFEMLTGQRAFRRDTSAETMSAILNEHPADVSRVRTEVGPAVDRIVQHCLEKQPSERFQSARDVAFALEALSGSASSAHAAPAPTRRQSERALWAAATIALAALAAWPWIVRRDQGPALRQVVSRTLLPLPEGVTLSETVFPISRLSLSPDGSQLALTGRDRVSGKQQVYLQPLDGGPVRVLAGSLSSAIVSWSDDARQVILTDATRLMRLSLDGGSPTTLLDAPFFAQRSPWKANGALLMGGADVRSVSVQGGSPNVVHAKPDQRYGAPTMLPDGRHYLVTIADPNGEVSARVLSLDSSDERELLRGADVTAVSYAAGAVVFTRGSTVFAQRLNLASFELEDKPVILAEQVESAPLRGAAFSIAESGVMVYQSRERLDSTRLTWLDRGGHELSTIADEADYTNVELSKDGRRLLASASDAKLLTRDIYIIDVVRGVRQRFTLDPGDERSAVWSPDDRRVIYTSKGLDLYSRASDLSGDEQPILKDGVSKDPYDWSPDGRLLLYRRSGAQTSNDLWLLPLNGGPSRPVAVTRFSEVGGNFSPDGRWIVYHSDESGQSEIYATRVDGGGRIQISSNGGRFPRWRSDNREILYLANGNTMMSAAILKKSAGFEVDVPKRLFDLNIGIAAGPIYDVTADGTRFIVAARAASQAMPAITVLHNWPQLLPRR